ncbi:MAG: 3-deoxy-manno-octulosonate cytidylyltransferase [Acidobacteriota bacterium]
MPVVFPSGLARSVRSAHIVALIPARYSSTRLPGKPLARIGDRTMIEHVCMRAAQARRVDAVLVATDDDRVAEAVAAFGGTAVMTLPTHESGTDRLAEVAAHLDCDAVINVQGDEPMISADAIDAVATLVTDGGHNMGTLRKRLIDPADLENPAVVKLVVDASGRALYFSRSPIPFTRPGHPQPPIWRHLGLYAYRRDFLLRVAALPQTPLERAEGLEQLRVLEHGLAIATVETTADTIGVDTPEDLERVRRLFEAAVPR